MSDSTVYPNAMLTEDGIGLDGVHIPVQWIKANPQIKCESGFFHQITFTVWAESIYIGPGVCLG